MKDVKYCSISSVAFILEIDAYDTLYNYIEAIANRYADNQDGQEIIGDIEARIAELILAVHSADRVVSKPLIDNIIQQMGSVDDICDDIPTPEESEPTEAQQPRERIKRRLYRNVDDASIGGVCSGVAAYIGCDATIIRIVALLLLIFGGSSFWVYMVLWIALRPATTARQKLEMRGEPITVSSIKDFYDSTASEEGRRTPIGSLFALIGRLLMVLFKIFMVCVLISFCLALVAVVLGLLAIVIGGVAVVGVLEVTVAAMTLISIALLLTIGVYSTVQMLNSKDVKWKPIAIFATIWLLITLATCVVAVTNRDQISERWSNITLSSFKTYDSF